MSKVTTRDIDAAAEKIQAVTDSLLPADGGFVDRVKAVEWRAQPHLLDEILWALYERDEDDKKEGEVDLEDNESALTYLVLWLAVEALDAKWRPPAGYGQD